MKRRIPPRLKKKSVLSKKKQDEMQARSKAYLKKSLAAKAKYKAKTKK